MNAKTTLMLIGFLGVFIHCLIKLNSLQTKAKKANEKFTPLNYISSDYIAILLSFAAVLLWLLVYEEVGGSYKKLEAWTKVSFAIWGLFGSYILQKIFSRGERKIDQVIDEKTNFADAVQKERDDAENLSNG